MFTLILILFLLWFVLSALMAAGTLFLQGYFNETPPQLEEVTWRAPAAGAAVTVFVIFWTILYSNNPDGFAPLTEFSSSVEQPPFAKLWVVEGGRRVEFNLRKNERGLPVFIGPNRKELTGRPEEIIVKEDHEETHFKPDRDDRGKFKPDPDTNRVSYRDEKGRVMQEGYLGQLVPERRTGRTFLYVVWNLLHAGIWFASLWLLLRFTWTQALLLSVVCWLTMTLVIVPPILTQAGKVAKERAKPTEETRWEGPRDWTSKPLPEAERGSRTGLAPPLCLGEGAEKRGALCTKQNERGRSTMDLPLS